MRLPAIRPQHRRFEAARELHEDLWRAYNDPEIGAVFLAAEPGEAGRLLVRVSGALHRFWADRGFRMRCKALKDKSGLYVWLEPGAVKRPRKSKVQEAA